MHVPSVLAGIPWLLSNGANNVPIQRDVPRQLGTLEPEAAAKHTTRQHPRRILFLQSLYSRDTSATCTVMHDHGDTRPHQTNATLVAQCTSPAQCTKERVQGRNERRGEARLTRRCAGSPRARWGRLMDPCRCRCVAEDHPGGRKAVPISCAYVFHIATSGRTAQLQRAPKQQERV